MGYRDMFVAPEDSSDYDLAKNIDDGTTPAFGMRDVLISAGEHENPIL